MAMSGSHDTTSGRSYHSGRLIGTVVAVVLLAAIFVGLSWAAIPNTINPVIQQWLHPGSKLALGESRIAHIPDAFERYSPTFARSWEMFKICSRIEKCDSSGLVIFRDGEIKREWPAIYDRLTVGQDWGEEDDTSIAHSLFLDAVAEQEKKGKSLRDDCVPDIAFRTVSNGYDSPVYNLDGYICT